MDCNNSNCIKNQIYAAIKNHPLMAFFLLTYLISWTAWGLIIVNVGEILYTPLFLISQFGPFIAALVITKCIGLNLKSWFSRIFNWRAPLKWYVLALVIPISIMLVASGVMYILAIEIDLNEIWNKLPGYFPTLVMITIIAGIGEEPGWRGFALPKLQNRFNPLVSTAILGLLWAGWHAPLLLVDQEFAAMGINDPFLLLGVILTTMFMIASLAFIYTWMYNNTKCVVLMMVLHGSVTTAISVFLPLSSEASHGPVYPLVLLTITAMIILFDILIIVSTKGRLGLPMEQTVFSE